MAARFDHAEAAEVLLKHGADVNARDEDGWTALHLAERYDRIKVAYLLRKYGAKY